MLSNIVISHDDKLVISTNNFKTSRTICLTDKVEQIPRLHHRKRMHVHDVVYIKIFNELAVSKSDHEDVFYDFYERHPFLKPKCCLQDEEVTAMDCWAEIEDNRCFSRYKKNLVFKLVQYYTRKIIFRSNVLDEISLKKFPTGPLSYLLKTVNKDFLCVKISIFFDDVCSHVCKPTLNYFAVCKRAV